MIPVIGPVFLYLRQKLGERFLQTPPNTIIITGENKNEKLELPRESLLYIKSIENYIEIFFINDSKIQTSKTFRQTLSKINEQLPFLEKCHRSFLVNIHQIKEIQGNSQSAKITFQQIDTKIPLSKTLYKSIKNKVDLN